jgi:Fatty acid desaturase
MITAKRWTLDDIPWDQFDPSKVNADLLKIVKAASLVEYNASDYGAYLDNVFQGDSNFRRAARTWVDEEIQHGKALGRWAKLADPDFDFDTAIQRFRDNFRIDIDADASIRGSRAGELIARCMVETGTSSYYSALAEAAEEPVLKAVCQKIAADELRHYKLFYTHLKGYLEQENMGLLGRMRVALGRISETEDDELACAYYAANAEPAAPYDRLRYSREYLSRAYGYYRHHHMERVVAMVFKACGLKPQTLTFRVSQNIVWWLFANRTRYLKKMAA